MATVKITDLTAYSDPKSTDVLPIVDVTNDTTKKVDIAGILKNAPAGSASATAFAFDGDPNTGIYSPGADQVALATGGTGRVFIDASGNVGIGTSSPIYKLQVVGTSFLGSNSTYGASSAAISVYNGSASANYYKADNHYFQLSSGADVLTTNSSGDVGIGTSSPGYKLDVSGGHSAIRGAYSRFWFNSDNTNFCGIYNAGASGAGVAQMAFEISGTERLRIDSSGNVGVGTASPSCRLHVNSTDAIIVPNGTTAQRPTAVAGMIRYNSTLNQFEGYSTAWGAIGGGATGGSGSAAFYENDITITASYTITSGKNAMTAGPIVVDAGVTITVPSGSTWTVV